MSHRSRLARVIAEKAKAPRPPDRKDVAADLLELIQVRNEQFLTSRQFSRRGTLLGGSGENGDRDYLAELRYPRTVTVDTYRDWWENDGLANRVVGVYPDECWARDPEVYDTEETRTTAFDRQFREAEQKLDLFANLRLADELSGIGGFGVILIGLADTDDLAKPAGGIDANGDPTDPRPDVEPLYLTPLDQTLVRVRAWDTDPKSRRYGHPTYYDLRLHDPQPVAAGGVPFTSTTLPGQDVTVHWSRVVHVPSDVRSANKLCGFPRLQGVFHRVFDVRWKLAGGSAEMYWQGALPGYAFEENEGEYDTQPIDKASLDQEFDLFLNRLQRYLAVQGGKVKSLAPQVSDPTAHMLQQLLLICAAIKCPLRTFLGSEQGHLAGESDTTRWDNRVLGRCTRHCDRYLLRALVRRLQTLGALKWTETLLTAWKDVRTTSEKDAADIGMKQTQSLLQYVTSGAFLLVPPKDYMVTVLRWDATYADAVIKKMGGEEAVVAKLTKFLEDQQKPSAQNAQTKDTSRKRNAN